jgi:hypothetical protein
MVCIWTTAWNFWKPSLWVEVLAHDAQMNLYSRHFPPFSEHIA